MRQGTSNSANARTVVVIVVVVAAARSKGQGGGGQEKLHRSGDVRKGARTNVKTKPERGLWPRRGDGIILTM